MKLRPRRPSIPAIISIVIGLNGLINLLLGLCSVFELPVLSVALPSFLQLQQANMTGAVAVFLGMVQIWLGKGLYSRQRSSWAWSLVVLGLLAVSGLTGLVSPAIAVHSITMFLALAALRRHFNIRPSASASYAQLLAIISGGFALAYGIVGSYLMRAEFNGIANWTDAVYFTFVTYSTLGYGDILPQTANAKIFVISMIVIGLTSFITAVTVLLGPELEKRMQGVLNLMTRFQKAQDHIVICGYSNVSESIIDELREHARPYLIIEHSDALVSFLRSKGHDVISGNATLRETLAQANVDQAAAIIAAFDSDSINTLIAVTAKELRDELESPKLRIIVRVEEEENIEKIRHLGIDSVVSPSTLGGRLMANQAIGTAVAE